MMVSSGPFRAIRFPYSNSYEGWGFWVQVYISNILQDYILTYYCAELCNTVTNLAFLYLGFRGIRSCLRQSHDSIVLIAYGGYMVVGLGSIAFHACLKYPMQLWDGLSMIYTTCLMMFASFSYSRSVLFSTAFGLSLVGLSAFISLSLVYYHMTKDPEFHQTAYGILTTIVVLHGMWVMEAHLRPALRLRHGGEGSKLIRTMWAIIATGWCRNVGVPALHFLTRGTEFSAFLCIYTAARSAGGATISVCPGLYFWKAMAGGIL
ncbi:hypothetical protein LLEC1_00112, partial [Akanthomyces lecanii]